MLGMTVGVRVSVGVFTGLLVRMMVGISVGVFVGVWVGAFVGVDVLVGVGVVAGAGRRALQKPPATEYSEPVRGPAAACPAVPPRLKLPPVLKVAPPPAMTLRLRS